MDFRRKILIENCPLVTVGLLSYNYANYIVETLDSILAQSYCNIQLFVVDDASKDNSVTIIGDWIKRNNVQIDFIVHKLNKGRTFTCNEIIRNAKGKYLVLFASDDTMFEHKIEEQVNELENVEEDVAICYGDAELMDEAGKHLGFYFKKAQIEMLKGDVLEAYINSKFSMPAPTVMIRKSVFEKVGFYDERLHAEDFGMWMKILPWYKVTFIKNIGVRYRFRENEIINSPTDIYHRDRIWILDDLFTTLHKNNKSQNVQLKIKKKLRYHIISLKLMKSAFFHKMFFYLIKKKHFSVLSKKLFLGN